MSESQALDAKRLDEPLPMIPLQLVSTNVPEDVLPRGENGELLILPTSARLLIHEKGLTIQMISRDPYEEEWSTFEDPNPPIITMNIKTGDILRLTLERYGWTKTLAAILVIRDPHSVVEGLSWRFNSTSSNNPNYWILVLANKARERLGVIVDDMSNQREPEPDIPF